MGVPNRRGRGSSAPTIGARHVLVRADRLQMVGCRAAASEQAARCAVGRRPACLERYLLGASHGHAVAGVTERVQSSDDLLQPLRAVAEGWRVG